jgi:hypothetical protein
LPKSSLAQTTFVPSRKAESQLPLGGTSADADDMESQIDFPFIRQGERTRRCPPEAQAPKHPF